MFLVPALIMNLLLPSLMCSELPCADTNTYCKRGTQRDEQGRQHKHVVKSTHLVANSLARPLLPAGLVVTHVHLTSLHRQCRLVH